MAALFTIAKTENPPKCPSTEKCRLQGINISRDTLQLEKKKKLIPFAVTRTDREIMMESEDRERQTP